MRSRNLYGRENLKYKKTAKRSLFGYFIFYHVLFFNTVEFNQDIFFVVIVFNFAFAVAVLQWIFVYYYCVNKLVRLI